LFETSIGHYYRIDEATAAGIIAEVTGLHVVEFYQAIADA
jgi:hypothetical protein